MCVSLLLMQTGAEPLATEVGGPRVASVPCCTHHCTQSAAALSRAVAHKYSAEVLAQFPHNQRLRRSGDVDFQAPFTIPRRTARETTSCRTKGHSITTGAVFPKSHTVLSKKVLATSTQWSTRRVLQTSVAWCT